LVVSCTVLPATAQEGTCSIGPGGTPDEPTNRRNGLYLNTAQPALCSGYIHAITFCYFDDFNSLLFSLTDYYVAAVIYRPSQDGAYIAVTETPITIRNSANRLRSMIPSGSSGCVTEELDNPVAIEAGDVIGVCSYDGVDDSNPFTSLEPLDIIHSGNDDIVALRNQECGPDETPQEISPSDIDNADATSSRTLFLSASISELIANTSLHTVMILNHYRIGGQ